MAQPCSTCACADARIKGECMACAMYRKRHGGQQRPESVIVKHGWRLIEKRLMADAT